MKKIALIVGMLAGAGSAGYAQQGAVASPAVSSTVSGASHTDTVQAVRQLFARRRTGGWVWTAVGAAFAVRIVAVAANSDSDAASGTAAGTAVGIGVLGGVPAGIGIGKLVRFSKEHENMVLAAYEQSKALPKSISRRLKKKYFI